MRISFFLQLYCINSACTYNVSVKSKLRHRPPTQTLPTPTPRHILGIWDLCRPREEGWEIWFPCKGWGIWTVPSISCEISGCFPVHVVSYHGGCSVRGFSWKRLCLCGQLVTRKELNKLCAVFEGVKILLFLILDSGFEYMNVLSCVDNEIQYPYSDLLWFNTTIKQYNNKKLNRGQFITLTCHMYVY